MAQNGSKQHLFELLKEDQEPFFLKDYIAVRRRQLRNTDKNDKTPTKPPIVSHQKRHQHQHQHSLLFPTKLLCQKASCFRSSYSSPDITKSPIFEFPSPIRKSPHRRSPANAISNPILLHIPARTAALLLEAALRIQKQSSKPKPKVHKSGLFGSLLKRLTSNRSSNTNKKKRKEIDRGIVRSNQNREKLRAFDHGAGCDCSRPSSSGVWSESNCEEKCLDSETSCSGNSQSEESSVVFVTKLMLMSKDDDDRQDYGFCDESEFCDQSPFRFVLQRSPSSSSSGRRTPEFLSPTSSPARLRGKPEGKEDYVAENSNGFQVEEELEEEEEKEQFSPVSVLDPPFEDDFDGNEDEDDHDHHEDDDHDHHEDEDHFDLETSYAIVLRTKQQLLRKLRRFERLAELDPIELEKRMLEEEEEGDDENDDEMEEHEEREAKANDDILDGLIREILIDSSHPLIAPRHMKRLVTDLIAEESHVIDENREEAIVRGVAKRLDSWKDVRSNTIDMMVDSDFRKTDHRDQIGEAAMEIELAIFGLLVDELAHELVCSSGN